MCSATPPKGQFITALPPGMIDAAHAQPAEN
jgi:hypothetical protein